MSTLTTMFKQIYNLFLPQYPLCHKVMNHKNYRNKTESHET